MDFLKNLTRRGSFLASGGCNSETKVPLWSQSKKERGSVSWQKPTRRKMHWRSQQAACTTLSSGVSTSKRCSGGRELYTYIHIPSISRKFTYCLLLNSRNKKHTIKFYIVSNFLYPWLYCPISLIPHTCLPQSF